MHCTLHSRLPVWSPLSPDDDHDGDDDEGERERAREIKSGDQGGATKCGLNFNGMDRQCKVYLVIITAGRPTTIFNANFRFSRHF